MVWLELLALALLGCAVGLVLGGGLTLWLQHRGLEIPGTKDIYAQFGLPSRIYPMLTPLGALVGPGAILTCILLGGIIPYLRVARLTPANAVRVG